MSEQATPKAKVLFRVADGESGTNVETLSAYDLGDDRYKLDNLPFYAYGVSCDDIVFAPFDDAEHRPTFRSVISKSGNRTVRIIFDIPVESGNASGDLLARLVHLGCAFEGLNKRYFAVNIPAQVGFEAVTDELSSADVSWEYADPTYEDMFPGEPPA